MSGNRLRSPVGLLALVACASSATAPGIATVPAPASQPSVTTDVVYGHKDGLALTLDVHRPAHPNGAGLISIVSERMLAADIRAVTDGGSLTHSTEAPECPHGEPGEQNRLRSVK